MTENGFQGDSKENYLSQIRGKYSPSQIYGVLDSLKDLKVLVVGDSIIDEYDYCQLLERAKKEPILVISHKKSDYFAGGIMAIANHVAQFSDHVDMATCVGRDKIIQDLLKNKVDKKVGMKLFMDLDHDTLLKKRYVDAYNNKHKFLEVYNRDSESLKFSEEEAVSHFEKNLGKYDLVILADFGHGFITRHIGEAITQDAKYLALNVQTNSGNMGFNLVTKYKKADFISLTSDELQLAMHDRRSSVGSLIDMLKRDMDCPKINITMGKSGMYYTQESLNYQVPVLSDIVVDTIGAGDAVLSITSMLSHRNASPELIPFIGNCVGALAVKTMGNKAPVSKKDLTSLIADLLNSAKPLKRFSSSQLIK